MRQPASGEPRGEARGPVEPLRELIAEEIVEKAAPTGEHGDLQAGVVGAARPPFQPRPGKGGLGGWWIATEVELLLVTNDVARPDVILALAGGIVVVSHRERRVEVWTRADEEWSKKAFDPGERTHGLLFGAELDVDQLYAAAEEPT
jgi:hypothetical protein